MSNEAPSFIRLEAFFETQASSEQTLDQWEENTLLFLNKNVHSLIKVYAGTTLLGEGRLVSFQGKYAIQLVRLS